MTVGEFKKILEDFDDHALVSFSHDDIVPPIPLWRDQIELFTFNGISTVGLNTTGVYDDSIVSLSREDQE